MAKEELFTKLRTIQLRERLQKLKKKADFAIQSLLFPKDKFDVTKAKEWAKQNGYSSYEMDETDKFIHIILNKPDKYNLFRTIVLDDNVKARVAGKVISKFVGSLMIKGLSKFSDQVKSDLDIQIPMHVEIKILCEGENRDGIITREDLESSLDMWSDIPIIDFHDSNKREPSSHKISDRKGYTLNKPQLKLIDGKMWLVTPGEIINREMAYQIYLRNKRNHPLEVSAEFGWNKMFMDGKIFQTDIHPHVISIVDKGHIAGNEIKLAA